MPTPLAGLSPSSIWRNFEAILAIPHCSGNEKPLGDYLVGQAKGLRLEWKRDKVGNVVVRKPASAGREGSPGVILQGHLDMVGEKNAGTAHDFAKDPIRAAIKDGWVQAEGTTLGADNGIGVATALAVMEDPSLVHGPLEFLFTVDEERGLTGARQIGAGFLKGKSLFNLDSEEEGTFTIGCAGGADSEIVLPLKRKKGRVRTALKVMVGGLRGGHSGLDIHTGRANAIKILAGVLSRASKKFDLDLRHLEGGSKHNAIPREAWAVLLLEPAAAKRFPAFLDGLLVEAQAEFGTIETDLAFTLEAAPIKGPDPLTPAARDTLLDFLLACPHGVVRMHPQIAGLTESSTNLAIVRCASGSAKVLCSSRSSIAPALASVRRSVKAAADLAGARVKQPDGYPGWSPNLGSPLLVSLQKVHEQTFGKEALVVAVHAGLECGLIGEKFPGMDMISFGPTIQHPHSPDERVEIASVEHFWGFLTAALKALG